MITDMNNPEEETALDSILQPLAEVYPQLYLTPGDEGAELCRLVVGRGEAPPTRSLNHFQKTVPWQVLRKAAEIQAIFLIF